MTQHTPWKLWNGYGPLPDGNYAVARIGPIIGGLVGAEGHDIIGTKKTLEYVVKTVNAHEVLLAAAKAALGYLNVMHRDLFSEQACNCELHVQLRAAIAAIEGKP